MEPRLSELEVERTGKGGRDEKKRGRIRCDTWKGETNNSRLPAGKGFLPQLGRNEMRSSYLHSRCKGLARIAYYLRQSLSCSLNKRRRNGNAPGSSTLDIPKEPRHCQKSKPGTKTQRREKPSSPTLKTGSQNSKKRKTQFSNTEGVGVEQKYS